MTVGTFDGIHRGHQAIFERVRELAERTGLASVLITFHPHPQVVVSPDDAPMLLTTIEEKEQFVPHFFEGTVLVLEFSETLMNLSAEEFIGQVLVDKVGVRKLVVGYDHALGKNRSGTISEVERWSKELRFDVEVVDPVIYDGAPVSSTRIRKAIIADRYTYALELLDHDYAIYGTVVPGIGLGRNIGYPTANVQYNRCKLLPPQGVYACRAQVGHEERCGMMFIGQNHFNPEANISVEANLFDFDRDVYGKGMVVYPTHFIRKNRNFENSAALAEQIELDKKEVLRIAYKGEKTCQ